MDDNWQTDHASALRLAQNVSELIQSRLSDPPESSQYSRKSAELRRVTSQFTDQVERMKRLQMKNAMYPRLSQREIDRRQGMLDEILTKQKQIEHQMNNPTRAGSFGGSFSQPRSSNPWDDDPLEEVSEMSTHQIRSHQENLINEQNEGLDILHEAVKRQQNMAVDMGNELDRQDVIIDEIHDEVEYTDTRVREETERVRSISLKASKGSCAMWAIIILLFIGIIVIVCLPKRN